MIGLTTLYLQKASTVMRLPSTAVSSFASTSTCKIRLSKNCTFCINGILKRLQKRSFVSDQTLKKVEFGNNRKSSIKIKK